MRLWCPLTRVAWQARGVGSENGDSGLAMRAHPSRRGWLGWRERQWGVVARRAARAHWVFRATPRITGCARAGCTALHRGVYALGHTALRPEGHRLAAVLACGPGAVLSHRSAAAHWGLLRTDQTRIDVTAPRGRHGAPGIRLHRTRSLDAQDTTHHQGIPITTVSRTLLDLAATARPSELERALAQSERLRLYDHRATKRRHSQKQRTPRNTRPRAGRQPHAQMDPERMGGRVPERSSVRPAFRSPRPTTPSTSPTTGTASPTTTGPNTASSSRPTASRPTAPGRLPRNDRAKDAALTAYGYRVLRFTRDDDPALAIKRLQAQCSSRRSGA